MRRRNPLVAAAVALAITGGCGSAATRSPAPPAVTTSSPTTPAPSPPSSTPPAPSTPSTPSTPPATSATRRTATRAPGSVPPLDARQRAAGLVDIRTVVPDAVIDLRYATTHNFTGVRLYPTTARCLVHDSMTAGLATAAARLRAHGLRLVFWDCYRPHEVQVQMFRIVPDPTFVARPQSSARSHESGRSVDVTLADATTGRYLDMGTGFDDFSARAAAFATDGVSAAARANRITLRQAMAAGGLTVYEGEWWHFDGAGADVGRPFLDAPVG